VSVDYIENYYIIVHGFCIGFKLMGRFLFPIFAYYCHLFNLWIFCSWLPYVVSRKTVDTEYTYYSWCMTSTDIVKWRKRNDYENFEKGMINRRILKKGGSRERGRRKRNPCPMRLWIWHIEFHVFKMVNPRSYGLQIEKFIELWTNKK
jgi:hypothetical protein